MAMSTVQLSNAQALHLWRKAHVQMVQDVHPDITSRQLAILLSVYLLPPPHTVRGMAARLEVAKPVITRALDTLGQLGLLKRRRDEQDRRSIFIERTTIGTDYLSNLSDLIVQASQEI